MEIDVCIGGTRRGISEYVATPKTRRRSGWPSSQQGKRLLSLRPRIERMARRQLGSNLEAVKSLGDDMLLVRVKVGTSTGPKKFALRSLLGWIELCDVEK